MGRNKEIMCFMLTLLLMNLANAEIVFNFVRKNDPCVDRCKEAQTFTSYVSVLFWQNYTLNSNKIIKDSNFTNSNFTISCSLTSMRHQAVKEGAGSSTSLILEGHSTPAKEMAP